MYGNKEIGLSEQQIVLVPEVKKRKPEKPGAAARRMRKLRKKRRAEKRAIQRAQRASEKTARLAVVLEQENLAPVPQVTESDPSVSEQFQSELALPPAAPPEPLSVSVTAQPDAETVPLPQTRLEIVRKPTETVPKLIEPVSPTELSDESIKRLVVFNELIKDGLTITEALCELNDPENDVCFEPKGNSREEKAAHLASAIADSVEKWGSNREILNLLSERNGLPV